MRQRFGGGLPGIGCVVRGVEEQDAVLHDQSHQQDHPHEARDVERHAGDGEHRDRAREAERHREDQGKGSAKAVELRDEHEHHRAEGQGQDAQQLPEGLLLARVLTTDLEGHSRRKRQSAHRRTDVGGDAAETASAGARGDRDVRPEIFPPELARSRRVAHRPDGTERYPAPGTDDGDLGDDRRAKANAVGQPDPDGHEPVGLASGSGLRTEERRTRLRLDLNRREAEACDPERVEVDPHLGIAAGYAIEEVDQPWNRLDGSGHLDRRRLRRPGDRG